MIISREVRARRYIGTVILGSNLAALISNKCIQQSFNIDEERKGVREKLYYTSVLLSTAQNQILAKFDTPLTKISTIELPAVTSHPIYLKIRKSRPN